MYEFSSIFIYFLSIIIVISAMTFVMLMTVVHEVSHRRHLLMLMAFCACNFLLQLLYLGMTVQDILIRYYHYSVYLRIADITLYTLQSYLWCRYLLFYPLKNTAAARHSKAVCNAIAGITLVLGIYNYAFNISNEFLYKNDYAIAIELLGTVLISFMLIHTIASLKRGFNKRFDACNIAITVLLLFIQWSTDISLILETEVGFSFSAHEYLTGSLQQILLTFMLMLYVYRTDYSGATLRERLSSIVNSKAAAADIAAKAAADADSANDTALAAATTDNNSFVNTDDAVDTSIDVASGTNSDSGSVSVSDSDSDSDPAADSVSVADSISVSDSVDIDQISMLFEQYQLTPREREVARLAYTGLTNPEIADRLCISQYTVKRHMHSVFEKLGISARIELVHLLSGH